MLTLTQIAFSFLSIQFNKFNKGFISNYIYKVLHILYDLWLWLCAVFLETPGK